MAITVQKIEKRQVNDRGFTLIELLVAMTIMLLVMSAISTTFQSQTRSWVTQQEIAKMQQNLRAGMFYLERSIRMAGFDPGNAGGFGFVANFSVPYEGMGATTDNDDIAFTIDDNENRSLDSSSTEMVAYRVDNKNQLQVFDISGGVGGWLTIASNISNLNFTYLDSGNVVTTVPADIRTVQITMTAQSSKASVTSTRSITSRVRCRNI